VSVPENTTTELDVSSQAVSDGTGGSTFEDLKQLFIDLGVTPELSNGQTASEA